MYDDFYLDNPEYEADDSYNPNPWPGGQLVTAVTNPMGSDAMRLAADYRSEGMDASEALKTALRDVKGESEDNPDIEISSSPLTLTILGIGVGLLIFRSNKESWP